MKVPQDVIDHCNKHPLCKKYPLAACVAPLANANDPRWGQWLDQQINAVRGLTE